MLRLGLVIATSYTAGLDVVSIDPVTGSIQKETQWFGHTTEAVIKTSAIEKWINSQGNPHSHDWKRLHATRKSLLGQTVGADAANAPPIYPLRAGSLDDLFVINSTEQEISNFVGVMQAGTEDEKQQAVQAAVQKATSQRPAREPRATP